MPTVATWKQMFQPIEAVLPGAGAPWMRDLRRAALEHFAATGFPGQRHEDWRYAALQSLSTTAFRPTAGGQLARESERRILEYVLGSAEFPRLVFVNGAFAPQVSGRAVVPSGVVALPLAAALAGSSELLEAHLGQVASFANSPFVALNTAFLTDGFVIRVPKNVSVETPLHLVFLTTPEAEPTFTCPRVLIVAEANSRVAVIESYLGSPRGTTFTNSVTEIVAEAGARVEHHRVQEEGADALHVGHLQMRVLKDAEVTSHYVGLGAQSSRLSIHGALEGTGSRIVLNGLFVGSGRQTMDHHTVIDHQVPHGQSEELYKGILDGQATGGFTGRVLVRQGALRTDAAQSSKNLLLSDEATINARPQLEIYADDVKCSHGATSGQLDQDSLFYLRSRGIAEADAKTLLTRAFADEVIDRIRIESLRTHLHARIDGRVAHARAQKEVV